MLRIEEIVGAMDDEFRYALDALSDRRLAELASDKAALRRLRPVGVSHAEALEMIATIQHHRAERHRDQPPAVATPSLPTLLPAPPPPLRLAAPLCGGPAIRLPPPPTDGPAIALPPPVAAPPIPSPATPIPPPPSRRWLAAMLAVAALAGLVALVAGAL